MSITITDILAMAFWILAGFGSFSMRDDDTIPSFITSLIFWPAELVHEIIGKCRYDTQAR